MPARSPRTAPGLSLLDRTRTTAPAGGGAGDDAAAIRATLERAVRAQSLGYHRFWVAEHHAVPGVVGPSPAVLLAAITSALEPSSALRVGSGGVMLPNHVPLVVAEQFAVLQALRPGRVDLGVGRSAGFTAPVRAALRAPGSDAQEFTDRLSELLDLLHGRAPVTVRPHVPAPPVTVLATGAGLITAAHLGLPVVVGGPALDDPAGLAQYRERFVERGHGGPHVVVLADVLVADDPAAARRELLPQAWSLAISRTSGRFPPLPAPGDVRLDDLTARERRTVDAVLARNIVGTEAEVRRQVGDLLARVGARELLVATTVHDDELRAESDARLADALLG
ncbi:MsnO8 family LLM class oxidoreductase [Kineococcus sp. SYSU DK018]|uniref:MsnO8 family LLM class oxidoreductase n=1 Tax=Kineococcus sp. SYSU DK018 TaxID=3383139 RepID=UPI003D7DBA70